MSSEVWKALLAQPIDRIGVVLFLLVFPVYHGLYPYLMRLFPNRAAKARLDAFRESWIRGLLERRDLLPAAQQTRNLTMVNSLLGSSSLILMGVCANLLIRLPDEAAMDRQLFWDADPPAIAGKLFLLIVIFAVAFGYCMTSLRHLGHFIVVIGADPELIERWEGSAIGYLGALVNRASNRHTLAVRTLYSASPVFFWLFSSWFFVALTLFWGIKFLFFQDFAHLVRGRKEAT